MRISVVARARSAVAVLVLVAGCTSPGDSTAPSSQGSPAAPPAGSPAASVSTTSLTFASWGGIYQDSQIKAFIEPFETETGIEVHDDSTLSYAKIQTMVDAGNVTWDVVTAEGFWAVEQCGKLLQPLDPGIVDLSQIDPALTQSECAAPLITYLSALYYNTETFTGSDHPAGCRDFFDTARFPGKRAAYAVAVPNALIECALLADGVASDALYPLDLDRAFEKLATIKADLIFWNIGADSEQLMSSGEVAMLMAFNGRAFAAITQQGAKFAPAYGESLMHYDALVVPKGVKDSAAAMELVNSMMDPDRQAALTALIPYPPTNKQARLANLPAGLTDYLPATNPTLAETVIVQDQRWWAANEVDVTRRWQELFQG